MLVKDFHLYMIFIQRRQGIKNRIKRACCSRKYNNYMYRLVLNEEASHECCVSSWQHYFGTESLLQQSVFYD
jgi:hypothetical protein